MLFDPLHRRFGCFCNRSLLRQAQVAEEKEIQAMPWKVHCCETTLKEGLVSDRVSSCLVGHFYLCSFRLLN